MLDSYVVWILSLLELLAEKMLKTTITHGQPPLPTMLLASWSTHVVVLSFINIMSSLLHIAPGIWEETPLTTSGLVMLIWIIHAESK